MDAMGTSTADELEALTQFLYLAPIGLVQAAADGEIVMINPMSAQLLMPLSCDGELTNLFQVLAPVAPDLRHRAQAYPSRHGIICDGVQLQISSGIPGRRTPQILSLTLLKLDDSRLMAVLSDVSVSVQRERALRQSQAWIDSIIAGITDYAMITLDRDGQMQCWNEGVSRLTGYVAEHSIGRSCALFYPGDALPPARLQDRLHEARRDGWSMEEGWRQRADGSKFWGSCLIAPLDTPDDALPGDAAFSFIIRDISDRKDAHEAMRQSVSCDHLTGLANRRAFFEAAEQELQRWQRAPRPLSMIVVDADHFKRVNDDHGHATGDAVLRHLAAALAATFRALDVVARVGGEEFAILLPSTTADGAAAVAARACQLIAAEAVAVDGKRIHYTVSAGVASMAPGIDCVEALMKRADAALYAAKAGGRNRVERWTDTLAQPSPLPQ